MNFVASIVCLSLLLSAGDAVCAPVSSDLSWRVKYDDAGLVIQSTDPAGRTTAFSYEKDKDGAVIRMNRAPSDGKPVSVQLDTQSRPINMTDEVGSVDYEYDDFGRLRSVRRQGEPAISYENDSLGRLTQLCVGEFYRLSYAYDFLNRIESIETPAGVVRYEYWTGQGTVLRILPNGVKTIREYEANGGLRQLAHVDQGNRILAEYTYQYRPDGLIDSIRERSSRGDSTTRYHYDATGRLAQATGAAGADYQYGYDTLGNRTRESRGGKPVHTWETDAIGRLTSANGKPCAHDPSGNLTGYSIPAAPPASGGTPTLTSSPANPSVRQFSFTGEGLLKDVDEGKISYAYDGNGRLLRRKSGSRETKFIPDPASSFWKPLVMEEKEGKRTLIVWDESSPLMLFRDGKTQYLLHDHLGSVRLVVDGTGKVVDTLDYDPFGRPAGPVPTADFSPRFAGLFFDSEAQVYLTLSRAYAPDLARFLQPDPQKRIPYGSQKDLSLYAYCGGDPVNFVDRDGAEPVAIDSMQLWWKAFFRDFFSVGDERDRVVREILDNALQKTGGDLRAAYTEVHSWRYPNSYPGKPSYLDEFPNAAAPTINELQLAENRMYTRKYIGTGEDKGSSKDTFLGIPLQGVPAAVTTLVRIPGWWLAHNVGENYHISPSTFLRGVLHGDWSPSRSTDEPWVRQTTKTIPSQLRGIWEGLLDAYAKPSAVPSSSKQTFGVWDRSTSTLPITIEKPKPPYVNRLKRPDDDYPPPFPPPSDRFSWNIIRRDDPWRPGGGGALRSPALPSPVGGVYLGGGGKSLEGVGLLDGITLDANNNLVLLGKDGNDLKLPALRVDDVVTVFRSVYLHGEGPTVTIDPASKNPEESAMIIRHGKATEDTYAGWVLYEADRLMKGYTLGVDNKTGNDVVSNVPDYKSVLETIYFGSGDPEKIQKEGHWERFWIVPAEARRFEGPRRELTLMDVPLKVKTQSMKWEKGSLVDDLKKESSPGAKAFTAWFTRNYDSISGEQWLTPPPEAGIFNPVPVFSELRRIALITAIAEKLRDQGVPLPFWMRDYDVKLVPFEKTTPGLRVTRSNQKVNARIFGGVELSPATQDVKTYTTTSNLKSLPPETKESVQKSVKLAGDLEEALRASSLPSRPLESRKLEQAGGKAQAVSMPGAGTRALGPCRLEETDLSVPMSPGPPLRLARSFHSFFDPSGPWGKGWALDLPRLVEIPVPLHREGSSARFGTAVELVTPLNSVYARFSKIQKVPSLDNAELRVPDTDGPFLGLGGGKPKFLSSPTRVVLLKDGSTWHFSEGGLLAAIEDQARCTVYERDGSGKITRIVGLVGLQKEGEIVLRYGEGERLEAAEGKNGQGSESVRFRYDKDGRLAAVASGSGTLGYQYQGPWVSRITWQAAGDKGTSPKEELLRSFEYGSNGQLVAETRGDGSGARYATAQDARGTTLTRTDGAKSGREDLMRFDSAMRPVEARYADGTIAAWTYGSDGKAQLEIKEQGKPSTLLTETADGRHRTLQPAHGTQTDLEYDGAGRMVSVSQNGQILLQQTWNRNGLLEKSQNQAVAAWREYDAQGLLSRVILAPPQEKNQFKHFRATTYDRLGRPVEIKDHSGLQMGIQYGESGDPAGVRFNQNDKEYGVAIDRDKDGRTRSLRSSWGNMEYAYDAAGYLKTLKTDTQGQTATVQFQTGPLGALPQKIQNFDGGETLISYHDKGSLLGRPQKVTTPDGLALSYTYDPQGALSKVEVGPRAQLVLDHDAQGRATGLSWRGSESR
jgi:RHS repeat-associated protein